jgi:hypothetical protein
MLRGSRPSSWVVLALAIGLTGGGCGSSASPGSSANGNSRVSNADARSAATGDIPDNQVFLIFRNRAAGYEIKYPEGWSERGRAGDVTFRDKANSIRVVVARGAPPSPANVTAALRKTAGAQRIQLSTPASIVTVKAGRAVKVSFSKLGSADPVTGKRPLLLVDRYVYWKAGKVATVDLSTPRGVDNVDAYKLISQAFAWR